MALELGGIEVAEVLHYFSDFEQTKEFYTDKLGWPVFFEAPGELLILDVRGHYQLGLVNARWTPGWENGEPVPVPQISFQCADLRRAHAALADAGCETSDVGGDPETMLTMELTDPWGNTLYFWQDASSAGSATGVEHEPFSAKLQLEGVPRASSPYGFGETLYYVDDLERAVDWYTRYLGLEASTRHGEAYTALQLDEGRTLGLMNLADWFDTPAEGIKLPPRLSLMVFDIAAEHARLAEAGIDVGVLKESGEGLKWFSFQDPDGVWMTCWRYEGGGG